MSSVLRAPQVPMRCPACKGPVAQRLAGRSNGALVWFQCFFCNHTWKRRLDDLRATLDGELTGDVFVVTPGGTRQPLGSVIVKAIPEEALAKHLERKTAHGERERAKVQREIDSVTTTLEKVRADEERLWKIQKRDENDLRKGTAWSVAYNRMKNLTEHLEALRAQLQRLTSGEHLFQDLPSAISSATTRADGTFTLPIPRDGRYGIVARASRELDARQELYCWSVWVSLDGQPATRLVLNNDNVVGAGVGSSTAAAS